MERDNRHRYLLAGSIMVLLVSLLSTSCEDEVERGSFITTNELNISDFLMQSENYTLFAELLDTTGLFDALNAYNPYGDGFTLMAPTNDAINEYIAASGDYVSYDAFIADSAFVGALVRYHIVLSAFTTNAFPYGALNDSTISGDYLTIGFQSSGSEGVYLINNTSQVIHPNLRVSNGVIHGLDKVLDPVIYNSYEWLKNKGEGVSIFVELLEQTGLADTMGYYTYNSKQQLVRNWYTLLVEPDSVFNKRGIFSFADLVDYLGTPGLPPEDKDNNLYEFAAYHILEQVLFLDDMQNGVYNTFTTLPVRISTTREIGLNPGSKKIVQSVTDGDTVFLDYVPIIYNISNSLSQNGPVHFISELLTLFKPLAGTITYHFKNEPLINALQNTEGTYVFEDPSAFEFINWTGVEALTYVLGGEAIEAWEDDYLELDGPFTFSFVTPRVFPGNYDFQMRLHADDYQNAVIQVYLDGKRIGTNLNLKSNNDDDAFVVFTVGNIDFLNYTSHNVTITTIIPGRMQLDMIRFEP